ncbi:MAG: Ppx/GppA phosphatase family protein [Acidobacteriota bacterium]|nr:Ppx/GppA phosphatase family protein [Acidobacteriota bacterium]
MQTTTAQRGDTGPEGTVAAVDLGSNSFHMVVARNTAGELTMLDRNREMVRLAAGLDEAGRIGPEAAERAIDCLRRFGQQVAALPTESVRAVGTNTLRRARKDGFLDQASEALGHPIEIISGIEEARLVYLGVARSLGVDDRRRLVVDIGGGSTELIVGERSTPLAMESLHMGCVASTLSHFSNGRVSWSAWLRAYMGALQEMEPVAARFRNLGWKEAVGSSGTIRAVRDVVREAGWSPSGITLASLHELREAIVEAGRLDEIRFPGLSEQRQPVFVGGVAIVLAIFEALGIERMDVADGALREGVLYDLLGRIHHEDTRGRTVLALMDRYHVDEAHATRVEHTALELLNQAAGSWKLDGGDAAHHVRWASLLHEIGLDIAHSHYQHHGAYIVEHADLPGFSLAEQQLVSDLVLAHRRKFPLEAFAGKPKGGLRMAVLLRLAIVLHRSRSDAPLPEIRLRCDNNQLSLRFPPDYLAAHPLTAADLEQEAHLLEPTGLALQIT